MLKIWGRLSSINVQKVVWTCDELGLEYERTDAGGSFGINNTPEYLAKNPNGLVPVIEEDGFVLYESNAIVRYLAAKYGSGKLWPADPRARADADRWMEWQATGFTPAMWAAFWQLVRTAPEKRDAAGIQASVAKTKKLAAILDHHLRDREHLAAGMFTPAAT
jgi:glutathione S-transferase